MCMKKYPDELPVFECDGVHYEVRPYMFSTSNILVGCFSWWLSAVVNDTGDGRALEAFGYARPLTRAARELLVWSRQR